MRVVRINGDSISVFETLTPGMITIRVNRARRVVTEYARTLVIAAIIMVGVVIVVVVALAITASIETAAAAASILSAAATSAATSRTAAVTTAAVVGIIIFSMALVLGALLVRVVGLLRIRSHLQTNKVLFNFLDRINIAIDRARNQRVAP